VSVRIDLRHGRESDRAGGAGRVLPRMRRAGLRGRWAEAPGRTSCRYALSAWPTSCGSGSRSRRRALPAIEISPARQLSMSPSSSRGDFDRAQAQPGHQHEGSRSCGCRSAGPVEAVQQPLHVGVGDPDWDTGVVPSGRRRHRAPRTPAPSGSSPSSAGIAAATAAPPTRPLNAPTLTPDFPAAGTRPRPPRSGPPRAGRHPRPAAGRGTCAQRSRTAARSPRPAPVDHQPSPVGGHQPLHRRVRDRLERQRSFAV